METKTQLTSAESTLSKMATVVLILGIISSILIFFTTCIAWKISSYSGEVRGMEGINWSGIPTLIYCIMVTLIAWSLLTVIVEISVNVRSKGNSNSGSNWKKDFALAITLGDKAKARGILYRSILESEQYKMVLRGGNDIYHQQCIETLNQTYAPYLKAVGEDTFKFTEENEILKVYL